MTFSLLERCSTTKLCELFVLRICAYLECHVLKVESCCLFVLLVGGRTGGGIARERARKQRIARWSRMGWRVGQRTACCLCKQKGKKAKRKLVLHTTLNVPVWSLTTVLDELKHVYLPSSDGFGCISVRYGRSYADNVHTMPTTSTLAFRCAAQLL